MPEDPMARPLINVEEQVGKVVGRRRPPTRLTVVRDRKAHAVAWKKAFDRPFVPRGVYRFQTHEEADEWMWKMITRPGRS
jgi:hypothetical protein